MKPIPELTRRRLLLALAGLTTTIVLAAAAFMFVQGSAFGSQYFTNPNHNGDARWDGNGEVTLWVNPGDAIVYDGRRVALTYNWYQVGNKIWGGIAVNKSVCDRLGANWRPQHGQCDLSGSFGNAEVVSHSASPSRLSYDGRSGGRFFWKNPQDLTDGDGKCCQNVEGSITLRVTLDYDVDDDEVYNHVDECPDEPGAASNNGCLATRWQPAETADGATCTRRKYVSIPAGTPGYETRQACQDSLQTRWTVTGTDSDARCTERTYIAAPNTSTVYETQAACQTALEPTVTLLEAPDHVNASEQFTMTARFAKGQARLDDPASVTWHVRWNNSDIGSGTIQLPGNTAETEAVLPATFPAAAGNATRQVTVTASIAYNDVTKNMTADDASARIRVDQVGVIDTIDELVAALFLSLLEAFGLA